jgi:hypothetical protein
VARSTVVIGVGPVTTIGSPPPAHESAVSDTSQSAQYRARVRFMR